MPPKRSALVALLLVATAVVALSPAALANYVGTGTHPWVFVLCKTNNQPLDPAPASYYQQMYADAGARQGKFNWEDWWHDVSFGQLSVTGTVIASGANADAKGWYTVNETRDTWGAESRYQKIVDCANAAAPDVDYSKYYGVVAIYPEAAAFTTAALGVADTTMALTASTTSPTPSPITTNYFPTVPFVMSIEPGGANAETVQVTAMNGSTFTIVRGQNGTTAKAHNTNAFVAAPGDFGAARGPSRVGDPVLSGQSNVTLTTGTFPLGVVILPNENNITGAQHETGHGFGFAHTRKLSTSTVDYKDATDVMSAFDGTYEYTALGTSFGGAVLGSQVGDKGPGLDALQLDKQGWIPSGRQYGFSNTAGNQATITLHALSDPNALSGTGYLEATSPAAITIEDASPGGIAPTNPPTCTGTGYQCTTTTNYSLEYRQQMGWDSGFPANAVLVHLLGQDVLPDKKNVSYWVDSTPNGHNGLLYPGDEYVDATNNLYLGVNAFNTTSKTAQITLGGSKINTEIFNSLATSQDHGQTVTVGASLAVFNSGAPIPNASIIFQAGNDSCTGVTDVNGNASCQVPGDQAPGSYILHDIYLGDAAYNPISTQVGYAVFGWTQQFPANSASIRVDTAMTYDPLHNNTVIFGGTNVNGNAMGSTWIWNGTTWTQQNPPESPGARNGVGGAMAFDRNRGKAVLFGGRSGTGAYLNDTWTWDGSVWTQLTGGVSPPAREHHSLVFDDSLNAILLFGGWNGTTALNDTWELTTSGWTQLSPSTKPSIRYYTSMAYDIAAGETVLFGGFNNGTYLNETWAFSSGNWVKLNPANSPSARRAAPLAYDPATGLALLFGGFNGTALGDTWTFDGTTWTQHSVDTAPSARYGAAMVYGNSSSVVLFGGSNGTTKNNETWQWAP